MKEMWLAKPKMISSHGIEAIMLQKYCNSVAYLLLAVLSLGFAYFFFLILRDWSVVAMEPNKLWSICEFLLSAASSIFGLVLFYQLVKNLKTAP